VFISYSRKDAKLARSIADHLDGLDGVMALYDDKFVYGHGFHEQIKTFIAYAHVFLPIVTRNSRKRGWVQQEIGYGMALNVPVLPIAVGIKPGEMLEGLQAITLEDEDTDFEDLLTREIIDRLIQRQDDASQALYTCAEEAEERAVMMRRYSAEVLRLGHAGMVRQHGALTSFHIPRETVAHRFWAERYGDMPRSAFYSEGQRQERLVLEQHARRAGARLIINPELTFADYGVAARISRISRLVDFLRSMEGHDVRVALAQTADRGESTTVVGDWFSATSPSGALRRGYRQTIFTRHAPTVRAHIEQFDEAFEEAIREGPWPDGKNSRIAAIGYLDDLVKRLGAEGGAVPS
jgi:hypothetical protein